MADADPRLPTTDAAEMRRLFDLQHAASRRHPPASLKVRLGRLDRVRADMTEGARHRDAIRPHEIAIEVVVAIVVEPVRVPPPPPDAARGTVLSGPVLPILCPPAPHRERRPRGVKETFMRSP